MNPDNHSRCGGINLTRNSGGNKDIFRLFGTDTEIFTRAFPRQKKPRAEGWLENLWSFEDILEISQLTYNNWGIALGQQIKSGHTVVFDKEAGGEIPEVVQQLLTDHAIAIWESVHGGTNYLLIVSEETYKLLDSFKTEVHITEGGGHDLELLTSGHALVPPSRINHALCDNSKDGCDGEGVSSYSLINTDSIQETNLETVRRLIDLLPVEEADESNTTQETEGRNEAEDFEVEELPEDFDIEAYCEENLPGTDSFKERLSHVIQDCEKVHQLWFTEPDDRSENELALRRELAWYFFGDRKIVQYIFEEILPMYRDSQLKYHENETHAKDVLNFEEYVSRPYYCTALSFNFREQLASLFLENEEITREEVHNGQIFNYEEMEQYSNSHRNKGLRIFEELELIEEVSENIFNNKNIDEEYVEELTKLNKDENYKPIQEPYEI